MILAICYIKSKTTALNDKAVSTSFSPSRKKTSPLNAAERCWRMVDCTHRYPLKPKRRTWVSHAVGSFEPLTLHGRVNLLDAQHNNRVSPAQGKSMTLFEQAFEKAFTEIRSGQLPQAAELEVARQSLLKALASGDIWNTCGNMANSESLTADRFCVGAPYTARRRFSKLMPLLSIGTADNPVNGRFRRSANPKYQEHLFLLVRLD